MRLAIGYVMVKHSANRCSLRPAPPPFSSTLLLLSSATQQLQSESTAPLLVGRQAHRCPSVHSSQVRLLNSHSSFPARRQALYNAVTQPAREHQLVLERVQQAVMLGKTSAQQFLLHQASASYSLSRPSMQRPRPHMKLPYQFVSIPWTGRGPFIQL